MAPAFLSLAQVPGQTCVPTDFSANHGPINWTRLGCNGSTSCRRCFEYAARTVTVGGSWSNLKLSASSHASSLALNPVYPATAYNIARSTPSMRWTTGPVLAACKSAINSRSESGLTVTRDFHITRRERGQKQLHDGKSPDQPRGKILRIARLMALAIHCDELIQNGDLTDQSELARFGQVTTARTTQILTLLSLAPDIQEAILFLPRTLSGRDEIKEADVPPIAAVLDWRKQRRLWATLCDERLAADDGSR